MKVGYEAMLMGDQDTGVGVAIRQLLTHIAKLRACESISVYTRDSVTMNDVDPNHVQIRQVPLASRSRLHRIWWQQRCIPRQAKVDGLSLYHATGYVVSPHHRLPTVLSVYDTIALDSPKATTKLNAWHYRCLMPRSIHAATAVIVPSVHVKKRLVHELNAAPEKIHVVPLGVDDAFDSVSRNECEEELSNAHLSLDTPFFLSVGTLERKKNIEVIIHAFARLGKKEKVNAKLVLVGKPGNQQHYLRRLIHTLHLDNDVIFTGFVSRNTLIALYNRAVALLYPSHTEGFGLPILEAMACNTPVISSNQDALPETVADAGILLPPTDIEQWQTAMTRLLSNTELRKHLIESGKQHASTYTWNRTAKSVLAVYNKALT